MPVIKPQTAFGAALLCRHRRSMLVGVALDYAGLNAVKMLFWSAVVNGVLAPPLVILVVLLTSNVARVFRLFTSVAAVARCFD